MKKEIREILSTKGRENRNAFIEDAVLAFHQSDLPADDRLALSTKENSRLRQIIAANEEYIAELESKISQLKKQIRDQTKVLDDNQGRINGLEREVWAAKVKPSNANAQPVDEERTAIKTSKLILLRQRNKNLQVANRQLVYTLIQNGLTVDKSLHYEPYIEERD
ncbi:hypothetical protein [Spirosoma luteum]|uniref:hypothetical protein n=1 Tax=Spirosoma luteum TaxID=431553 RepID=UPI000371C600|nr:hypothetical protein [Spirosoma luteum]